MRGHIELYSKKLGKRRDLKVQQDKDESMTTSRTTLAVGRATVETCKQDIVLNLELLLKARTHVSEEQEKVKEKKKESSELAQEAGILASKAHSAEELIEALAVRVVEGDVVAQAPFTDAGGVIAGLLEEFREGVEMVGKGAVPVSANGGVGGVHAGHENGAGG